MFQQIKLPDKCILLTKLIIKEKKEMDQKTLVLKIINSNIVYVFFI